MASQYCTKCQKPLRSGASFCTQCGAVLMDGATMNENIQEKSCNERSAGNGKKVILAFFTFVLAILVLLVIQFITFEEHGVIAQQPMISESVYYTGEKLEMTEIQSEIRDEYFILSLDDIKEYKFVRAWYQAPTSLLPVVAYISPKGRLVTAIGITEPCGESNYTIVDNHIHCGSCTGEWDMNSMKAFGSCPKYYPQPIQSRVDGTTVLIAKADLQDWRRRW